MRRSCDDAGRAQVAPASKSYLEEDRAASSSPSQRCRTSKWTGPPRHVAVVLPSRRISELTGPRQVGVRVLVLVVSTRPPHPFPVELRPRERGVDRSSTGWSDEKSKSKSPYRDLPTKMSEIQALLIRQPVPPSVRQSLTRSPSPSVPHSLDP